MSNPCYHPLAVAGAVALLTASFQLGALASSNLLLDFTGGSANTFGPSTTAGFQFTLVVHAGDRVGLLG